MRPFGLLKSFIKVFVGRPVSILGSKKVGALVHLAYLLGCVAIIARPKWIEVVKMLPFVYRRHSLYALDWLDIKYFSRQDVVGKMIKALP